MTNMITAITEALRRRRNINATITELHSLSDADLRDIGIYRENIEIVARGLIDIPVEASIGQAGAKHTLVAGNHLGGIIPVPLAHHEEVREKIAVLVFHGKLPLMGAHGDDHHLPGDLQKPRVK